MVVVAVAVAVAGGFSGAPVDADAKEEEDDDRTACNANTALDDIPIFEAVCTTEKYVPIIFALCMVFACLV